MSPHLIRQNLLLRLVTMLKQLLHNIVTEDIGHQLQTVWLDLSEHLLLFVAVGSFQLLLNKTRAMLVATEFDNVIVDVLQLDELGSRHNGLINIPSIRNVCFPCCWRGIPPEADFG